MSDSTFYLTTALVMCVSIWVLAKVAGFLARTRDTAIKTVDWDPVDEHFSTTVREEP